MIVFFNKLIIMSLILNLFLWGFLVFRHVFEGLIAIPLTGLSIIIINCFLGWVIGHKRYRYLLLYSAILCQVLLIFAILI